jgi:hypothetical protein
MRILALFAFLIALFLSPPPTSAGQQALPPQPGKGQAVCVAVVANASAKSAFVERMTERLTKSLKDNKLIALMLDSSTTTQHKLEPTAENGDESRQKDCDYILLTQILDPQAHPLEPQMPTISIGGRVPGTDASDPMGGSSGPVYRDNLRISFALFRRGQWKPVLDTFIQERPSGNVSDSLLPAMDREANRVSHEVNKN